MIGFQDERKKIAEIINMSNNLPRLAELFLSQTSPRKTIEDEISKSDCYIGIFHERWGYVPSENNPENLSVTALEFQKARELNLPCLILQSNLPKEAPLEKFLKKIGDFEDNGVWEHHYNDFAQLSAIVSMWLEKFVNNPSTNSVNYSVLRIKLKEHNKKYQSLIKDNISKFYEKPEDFDKISSSIKKANTWLIGERGIGKSVILKKITEELESKMKKVLYIRAEDIQSKKDFLNVYKDDFGVTLDKLISTITQKDDLYLIIDSIDTIQKIPLVWSSFSIEIISLQLNSKLHTVLAIRKSDYVTFPNDFKKEWGKEIFVKGFSIKQVEKILKKLKILKNIDSRLYPILQIPFYLDLITVIIDKGRLNNFSTITNQYQFLQEHYNRVIRNSDQGMEFASNKVTLLQNIVQKMFESKKFKISNGFFPSSPEFDRLRSDGVILDNDYNIEFFHQVYFDFIMSLKIIQNGKIINFLIEGHEFFLRSTIYFTLAFLRATNYSDFISNVEDILTSKLSFYWKRLTMEFFADMHDIDNKDKEIIEKILANDGSLQGSFLEYLISNKNSDWYQYLEDTLFQKWSLDDQFQHGLALSEYIKIGKGVKND